MLGCERICIFDESEEKSKNKQTLSTSSPEKSGHLSQKLNLYCMRNHEFAFIFQETDWSTGKPMSSRRITGGENEQSATPSGAAALAEVLAARVSGNGSVGSLGSKQVLGQVDSNTSLRNQRKTKGNPKQQHQQKQSAQSSVPGSQHATFEDALAKLREAERQQAICYSGWLTKKPVVYKSTAKARKPGLPKRRFFRLTTEALYYFRESSCKTKTLRGRVAFSISTKVVLTRERHCFQIEDDTVCCTLQAESEGECTEWVCQLQRVVEAYQRVLRHANAVANGERLGESPVSSPVLRRKVLRSAVMEQKPYQCMSGRKSVHVHGGSGRRAGRQGSGGGHLDRWISSRQRLSMSGQTRKSSRGAGAYSDDGGDGDGDDEFTSADDMSASTIPTIRQAMSTCKKRGPSSIPLPMPMATYAEDDRLAVIERENRELRERLELAALALAAQDTETDDNGNGDAVDEKLERAMQKRLAEFSNGGSNSSLVQQMLAEGGSNRSLVQQLIMEEYRQSKQPQQRHSSSQRQRKEGSSRSGGRNSGSGSGGKKQSSRAALKPAPQVDAALLKRRMNIEAHHETCRCAIM